jgi:CRISPR-associated exonuclease Cas4
MNDAREEGPGQPDEDELLPLSGLGDVVFCARRAGLHFVEGLWEDNLFTAEGAIGHERAHEGPRRETRGSCITVRGLRIRSWSLAVSGIADVVEFHRVGDDEEGTPLAGLAGRWRPFPIEYKRGRLRHERSFMVQLCAQAICLEEMLGVSVPRGALFYGKSQRRLEVEIGPSLREETAAAAGRFREIVASGATPPTEAGPKCKSCSMEPLCLPRAIGQGRSARRYVDRALAADEEAPP